MPRIIATDEAGYGPRLGPLVVAASVWDVRRATAESAFDALGAELPLADGSILSLRDSKEVFKRKQVDGLEPLERAVAIFLTLARRGLETSGANSLTSIGECLEPSDDAVAVGMRPEGVRSLRQLVRVLAPLDVDALFAQPWFDTLDAPFPTCPLVAECMEKGAAEVAERLEGCGIAFLSSAARVMDAGPFNALCDRMGNKATVLSETTVDLVRRIMHWDGHDGRVDVFSDRHGGRHRYAPLLQQFFPDAMPRILREDAQQSRYVVRLGDVEIDWRFTVKGDSFPPVAFSSLTAKYLRERMMERWNVFWADHHSGTLAPTAGYAADATRFCQQIAPTARRLGIAEERYIRAR